MKINDRVLIIVTFDVLLVIIKSEDLDLIFGSLMAA